MCAFKVISLKTATSRDVFVQRSSKLPTCLCSHAILARRFVIVVRISDNFVISPIFEKGYTTFVGFGTLGTSHVAVVGALSFYCAASCNLSAVHPSLIAYLS